MDDLKGEAAPETAVAMDASGRFVVAWQDSPASNISAIEVPGLLGRRAPLTGVTRVATATGDGLRAERGRVQRLVRRRLRSLHRDPPRVLAQHDTYASGVPVGHGTFIVDASGQGDDLPSVAMAPDGRFGIAYEHYTSLINADVDLARYTAAGTLAGKSSVSVAAGLEPMPSVAMDYSGNAVVAYVEPDAVSGWYSIFANRVTAAGTVGPPIAVADSPVSNDHFPSVALAPTTGEFVVADTKHLEAGVHVQEFRGRQRGPWTSTCRTSTASRTWRVLPSASTGSIDSS